ncbi:hypothetical protein BDM02DRAFT_3120486 [Thelephora ganbajun]|uniref:Uncharacterized protein n=1 Tax=Thelephora ganbajun TaxID=370292 RepID=A0ACB6Z6J0_THEGA|nr:hypothetical protein BDM02DRAFT_3120486 [Thelephora ganbajun]
MQASSTGLRHGIQTQAYIIQRGRLSPSSSPPAASARCVLPCPAVPAPVPAPEPSTPTLFKSNATPRIGQGGDRGPTTVHQLLASYCHRGPSRDARGSKFVGDLDVRARHFGVPW